MTYSQRTSGPAFPLESYPPSYGNPTWTPQAFTIEAPPAPAETAPASPAPSSPAASHPALSYPALSYPAPSSSAPADPVRSSTSPHVRRSEPRRGPKVESFPGFPSAQGADSGTPIAVTDQGTGTRPAEGGRNAAPATIVYRTDTQPPAEPATATARAISDDSGAAQFTSAQPPAGQLQRAPYQGAANHVVEYQARPVQQARSQDAALQVSQYQVAPAPQRRYQAAQVPAGGYQARVTEYPAAVAPVQPARYPAAVAPVQPARYPAAVAPVQPARYAAAVAPVPPAPYPTTRHQPAAVQSRPYPAPPGWASSARPVSGGVSIPRSRPSRPGTLTLGVLAGLGSTGLVIASQAIGLLQGREAIRSVVSDQIPGGARTGVLNGLLEAAVNAAYHTIQVRAFLALGLAAIALVLILLSLRGALAVRIPAVLATVAAGAVTLIGIADIFPARGIATGVGALLLVPVTAVLLLLPSASRYRRATRAARAA